MQYTKDTKFEVLYKGFLAGEKPNVYENFLDNSINLISSEVTPIKGSNGLYSSSLTLDAIDNPNIKYLIMSLYEIPRSKLLGSKTTLVKNTRIATATPLPLAAFKQLLGIKYEDWDKGDPKLKYMLGKHLAPGLLSVAKNEADLVRKYPPNGNPKKKDILAYRDILGASPLNYRTMKHIRINKIEEDGLISRNFYEIPAIVVRMLMQLWIFHGSVRDTSGMQILDPFNWDNIPEAVDQPIVDDEVEETLPEDRDPLSLPF